MDCILLAFNNLEYSLSDWMIFLKKSLCNLKKAIYLQPLSFNLDLSLGTLAQLVEQRTENPCVPGSIPGGTTKNPVFWQDFFLSFFELKSLKN